MNEIIRYYLTDKEKKTFIAALTDELPILRTKADISQEDIANLVGVSRQTYGAIERKARKMSWNTYLSLILFYDYNKDTHDFIRKLSAFPHELIKRFNEDNGNFDLEIERLLKTRYNDILSVLDEQAISTIKTVVMVEYTRCNSVSGDAIIKLFEGVNLSNGSARDVDIKKALNNLHQRNELE